MMQKTISTNSLQAASTEQLNEINQARAKLRELQLIFNMKETIQEDDTTSTKTLDLQSTQVLIKQKQKNTQAEIKKTEQFYDTDLNIINIPDFSDEKYQEKLLEIKNHVYGFPLIIILFFQAVIVLL